MKKSILTVFSFFFTLVALAQVSEKLTDISAREIFSSLTSKKSSTASLHNMKHKKANGYLKTNSLQTEVYKTVACTAGSLSTSLTTTEKSTVTNLTLTGVIDSRDFKTMRDLMPLLAVLDLSNVAIAGYTGTDGTEDASSIIYPANAIPNNAFYSNSSGSGKNSLTSITLPTSITIVGTNAFAYCTSLTGLLSLPSLLTTIGDYAFSECGFTGELVIPSSITYIGESAFSGCDFTGQLTIPSSITTIKFVTFSGCTGFTSISIPSSVTSIEFGAFAICGGLITVDTNNPNYSSLEGVLFNKSKTVLIQCPTSKTGAYTIPASVITLGKAAFSYANQLTSITIPSSVTTIDTLAFYACIGLSSIAIPSTVTTIHWGAFYFCSGLTSIYAYPQLPINLTSSSNDTYVFYYVNKTTCTLYVPFGAKSAYQKASQWKDFINIVEMSRLALSSTEENVSAKEGSKVSINIITDTTWMVTIYQTWLTASQVSGTGNATVTFTAEENPTYTDRTAMVDIFIPGSDTQTITVIQAGGVETGVTAVTIKALGICPNPVTDNFYVVGLEDKATIRLSDLNGRLLLAKEITGNEQVSLSSVPKGLYVLIITLPSGTIEKKIVKIN
jgi:hypothetical protein